MLNLLTEVRLIEPPTLPLGERGGCSKTLPRHGLSLTSQIADADDTRG
jgi:hypothetical protein